MKRKWLTNNQKLELWDKYGGKCWRCGLPIDQHRRGDLHWGHIIAHSLGGASNPSNMAPEHSRCNLDSARATETPVAAKTKRVRIRDLGLKEPSQLAKQYARFKLKWKKNWKTGRMERRDDDL